MMFPTYFQQFHEREEQLYIVTPTTTANPTVGGEHVVPWFCQQSEKLDLLRANAAHRQGPDRFFTNICFRCSTTNSMRRRQTSHHWLNENNSVEVAAPIPGAAETTTSPYKSIRPNQINPTGRVEEAHAIRTTDNMRTTCPIQAYRSRGGTG